MAHRRARGHALDPPRSRLLAVLVLPVAGARDSSADLIGPLLPPALNTITRTEIGVRLLLAAF